MKLRAYFSNFLTTTLFVVLTCESAIAFKIKYPPPDSSNYYVPYQLGDYEGVTWLPVPTALDRGGTNELLKLLNDFSRHQGGKWTFVPAENDLQGSFDIQSYYACGPQTHCGIEMLEDESFIGGVGAFFEVEYHPGGDTDSIPNKFDKRLHWVQRIKNNHKATDEVFDYPFDYPHGTIQDALDISTGASTPYYPTNYDQLDNGTPYIYFQDTPYRFDPLNDHTWNAFLFLTEDITPRGSTTKTIRIHNGIKWGWRNQILKRPNSVPACPPGSEHNLATNNSDGQVASDSSECVVAKKFSDSLSSGTERDNFNLDGLTPGATFYAWINNDIPSNQCNPNTYLSGYDDEGYFLGADDNSSHLGDGFASSVLGTVSSNGRINLSVKAADGGRRGEDEGNYELYVNVFNTEDSPIGTGSEGNNNGSIPLGGSGGGGIIIGGSGGGGIIGGSGGGGVILGNEDGGNIEDTPGRTQQNPILPSSIDSDGWQHFSNVPGCRWYNPPIEKGFEFVATDDTLFTEILDFPVGEDDLFTVMVDDLIEETYFPIQLAFDKNVGSFKMRPIVTEEETKKQKVPESNSVWGLIGLGAFGVWKFMGLRNRK